MVRPFVIVGDGDKGMSAAVANVRLEPELVPEGVELLRLYDSRHKIEKLRGEELQLYRMLQNASNMTRFRKLLSMPAPQLIRKVRGDASLDEELFITKLSHIHPGILRGEMHATALRSRAHSFSCCACRRRGHELEHRRFVGQREISR